MTPRFIADILRSAWLWHVARVLVTFMYWFAALDFLMDFSGAKAAMASADIQPPWLVAVLTIAVQVSGSALIILDRAVWLGAGMLAVFTLLTIPLTHPFWSMTGIEATQAMIEFEEHLTVVGGLIMVSVLSIVRKARPVPAQVYETAAKWRE